MEEKCKNPTILGTSMKNAKFKTCLNENEFHIYELQFFNIQLFNIQKFMYEFAKLQCEIRRPQRCIKVDGLKSEVRRERENRYFEFLEEFKLGLQI